MPLTFFTAMAVMVVTADMSAMGLPGHTDMVVTLVTEATPDTKATLDTGATLDTEATLDTGATLDTEGIPHMAMLAATATVDPMAATGEVFESRRLTLGSA